MPHDETDKYVPLEYGPAGQLLPVRSIWLRLADAEKASRESPTHYFQLMKLGDIGGPSIWMRAGEPVPPGDRVRVLIERTSRRLAEQG